MFLFKKVVAQFLFPMPLCLALCVTGLALLWFSNKQKAGRVLVTLGVLLLIALSSVPVANALLLPLERRYPTYVKQGGAPVKFVVVLGGGHDSDRALPVSSQLGDESLKRLVEGIRVYRANPGSKLILSGGHWLDPVPHATLLSEAAADLGIRATDIVLESESRDTEDEARLLAPMLGTNRFVLLTSASHLPRAMALFEKEGLKPEPAPAGHLVKASHRGPDSYFPGSKGLRRAETAFYEYMGAAWVKLRSLPSPSSR
jgi:uncharacterized SAM-binding protein YcdF (DUF218 family)